MGGLAQSCNCIYLYFCSECIGICVQHSERTASKVKRRQLQQGELITSTKIFLSFQRREDFISVIQTALF